MIGVLLVNHGRLGSQLVATVNGMLGELTLATETVPVHRHDDPDELAERARAAAKRVDAGDGVIVLTDVLGSTPSNIANRVAAGNRRVVAGVNVPMLVRIYNYPTLALEDMVTSALEGGRTGILPCADQEANPNA